MNFREFEKRKKDHIQLSLQQENQAIGFSGLDRIYLSHEALPNINFSDISLETKILDKKRKTPFYVGSMTAGHPEAVEVNCRIAESCQNRGWIMGVGSQRRQLFEKDLLNEWSNLRKKASKASLIGNIGISQLIRTKIADIQRLVDSIHAEGIFIHLNSLQESLQPEGTPQFKGGLLAIEQLCRKLEVPVLIKETGCGFSSKTLKILKNTGIRAVDLSGLGGTHWGRIEGGRSQEPYQVRAAKTFQDWGIGTVQSLLNGIKIKPDYELWSSGGVRTGLDAAKLLVLGARAVGYAQPVLKAALEGSQSLNSWMETIEFELKTAMFVTGTHRVELLRKVEASWK